jgi:hypothetical protein
MEKEILICWKDNNGIVHNGLFFNSADIKNEIRKRNYTIIDMREV